VARLLWATAALGVAFMVLKGIEWWDDGQQGFVPGPRFALAAASGAELFFIVYFIATGLHALHLTIGVGVLATFAVGAGRGRAWARPPRLQVAALYWHFVDLVWIFLWPLLYLVGRSG
jgi:cytochrome c oxidase subunit 3